MKLSKTQTEALKAAYEGKLRASSWEGGEPWIYIPIGVGGYKTITKPTVRKLVAAELIQIPDLGPHSAEPVGITSLGTAVLDKALADAS